MDEAQVAIETTSELARIAQELNNLQMLFLITVLLILSGTVLAILFWRVAVQASKSDASIQTQLLVELSHATKTASNAIEAFSEERKVYWARNTQEHKQIITYIKQSNAVLRQVVVTLNELKNIKEVFHENSNEVDTEPMEKLIPRSDTIQRISPILNPND